MHWDREESIMSKNILWYAFFLKAHNYRSSKLEGMNLFFWNLIFWTDEFSKPLKWHLFKHTKFCYKHKRRLCYASKYDQIFKLLDQNQNKLCSANFVNITGNNSALLVYGPHDAEPLKQSNELYGFHYWFVEQEVYNREYYY